MEKTLARTEARRAACIQPSCPFPHCFTFSHLPSYPGGGRSAPAPRLTYLFCKDMGWPDICCRKRRKREKKRKKHHNVWKSEGITKSRPGIGKNSCRSAMPSSTSARMNMDLQVRQLQPQIVPYCVPVYKIRTEQTHRLRAV